VETSLPKYINTKPLVVSGNDAQNVNDDGAEAIRLLNELADKQREKAPWMSPSLPSWRLRWSFR